MPHILVADKIAEEGLQRLRQTEGVTFDVKHGLSPEQLADEVKNYDGMLIRSAVKVTSDVLKNPGKLAAIARAGVGVDNVDLEAATAAGVLVLNTPDANTISTAEHTWAVMLALHRRVADAHAHVKSGEWNRAAFKGDQLAGKTLGVVGYGRIGRAVVQRALAFEMAVVVYDPFVAPSQVANQPIRLVSSLKDMLEVADCVTLHASLSDDTRHLINAASLSWMKPSAKLVNCARGALIDETALADALNAGTIAGAALDVYANEPPEGSPLLGAKNILLTPHLAASTVEAQQRVSVDAVEALLAYLVGCEIRSAVNVSGLPASLSRRSRAFLDLTQRMGSLLATWSGGGVDRITVTVGGDALEDLARTLAWQAMVSVVGPHLDARLNLVNAKEQAAARGIAVEHVVQPDSPGRIDTVTIRVESGGDSHEVEGTVLADGKPRVLGIDGYRMELIAEQTIVLIFNDDRPGVIGLVGQCFGEAEINIADMALSRRGKTALMVLKLDVPMPTELRDSLRAQNPPIFSVRSATLPPVCQSE